MTDKQFDFIMKSVLQIVKDALALAIATTKDIIAENTSLLEEKRKQLDNKETEISRLDYYYEQFVSWADEFDNATPERKRMILCSLFKVITVGKDYKIDVLLDNSYEQFIA